MFYLINAQLTSAGTLKSARYAWLITDNTGTPLIALDDQGKPLWKGTRDAFAAVVPAADSQITVNLRYAGQYADAETGLYYNGFRYYDPLTGRYLQPDPLGLSGGLNSYTYALNNPLRYIDPEGQHPVAILLIWTARFAVGWAIDYLIGYLPDNECNPLLSPRRWVNAASYAIGISAAQKGVKALTAAAKLRRGLGGRGAGETAGSIREVNPGYPGSGRTHNCVNCSIATDSTLAGRPASALPNPSNKGVPLSVLEKQYEAKFVNVATSENITQQMINAGSGSRAIVYGSYGQGQTGHVFNVVNQNGKIRFLDGQTGNPVNLNQFKSFQLLRTN